MNENNRKKVLDYLNSVDSLSPLYFGGYVSEVSELKQENFTVASMVKRVLSLSEGYSSIDSKTDELECFSDRWRSVIDIWRHIIYYYPEITIFDVMHSIFEIYTKELRGQFCNNIERRTFKIKTIYHFLDNINYQLPERMAIYSGRTTDEFDLVWSDWENI